MSEYRHGLLIGKFYPPHRGHHDAIRLAAARCDEFTVVVMAAAAETVPLADRTPRAGTQPKRTRAKSLTWTTN